MKITKSRLKEIIKEEMEAISSQGIDMGQLPMIYRIEGFVDFLDDKGYKYNPDYPEEVFYRGQPTKLREVWREYKINLGIG